jgi:hypothetical protein
MKSDGWESADVCSGSNKRILVSNLKGREPAIKEMFMSVETLEAAVKALQEEVREQQSEIHILQRNQSSRRGPEGGRGETGPVGPAGKNMELIVKTDVGTNTIHVFGEDGNEKASIVAVPGPSGAPGQSITGPKGEPGKDGRSAPSLQEIVEAVVRVIEKRLVG